MPHGDPDRNTIEVDRHRVRRGLWGSAVTRTTLRLVRRGYWGVEERRQFTINEQRLLRALRAAGYSIVPPPD